MYGSVAVKYVYMYTCVYVTASDVVKVKGEDPATPGLLPQEAGRPKLHRRHKSGLELGNAKKRSRAPPSCMVCGMTGHKSNNTSWHPKT